MCAPGFFPPQLLDRPDEALRKLRLIVNDTHVPEWQEWARAHGLNPPSMRGAIMLHASDQVLGAATEGWDGDGRRPLVDRWLSEGRLVAPFGAGDLSGAAYFLVWPEEIELPVAARKVARWLHDMAKAETEEARRASAQLAHDRAAGRREPLALFRGESLPPRQRAVNALVIGVEPGDLRRRSAARARSAGGRSARA